MATGYVELAERTKEIVLLYAQQQWPILKSTNGVEVSCCATSEAPCKAYKSVGVINAPPATTLEYILPGPLRLHWDKQVKSTEVVETVQKGLSIVRSLTRDGALGLISPREYIDLVSVCRNADGGLYFSYSTGIDYPYPEDPTFIRGRNHPSSMMCFPLEGDPSRTKLIYTFQTDLRGKIPPKLIETTLPSIQITFFKNLRKAIKENFKEKTGKTCCL